MKQEIPLAPLRRSAWLPLVAAWIVLMLLAYLVPDHQQPASNPVPWWLVITFAAALPVVGPWVMLLEYLESPAFKQTKPQLLVWQMFEPSFNQGPDAAGLWDNAAVMPVDTWTQRVSSALGGAKP